MTSSPNLDLVRSILAAWERGDMRWTDWADPDIQYVNADGPNPGSWSGLGGMAHGGRDWLTVWEKCRVAADEHLELDGDRVLVLVHYTGRGKTSGLDVREMPATGAHLFHVRDGKVTRQVVYWNRDRALADLGLAPETGSAS